MEIPLRRNRWGIPTAASGIDLAESKDAIEVTAELPGVDEKDLDVTLANGMLTIRGEKRTEHDEQDKDKNWHVVERSYGSFSRAIPLPFDPDPAKVEAKFDKGVLHIHLPKPAEVAQNAEAAKDRHQESLKYESSASYYSATARVKAQGQDGEEHRDTLRRHWPGR
jgi:HSP20 family molecular chaperone IbpA